MSTIKNSEFTEFELSDPETLAGQIYSVPQLQVLQNLRADFVREKLNLKFTPHDIQSYLQQEAEITGKIGTITYLIETSAFATTAVMTDLSEAAEENKPEDGTYHSNPDKPLDGGIFRTT